MIRWARTLLLSAMMLLPGCGSDGTPFSPTVENVSGSYEATTFTAGQRGITTNLLNLGATLHLTLNTDGTTEGRLFAPGLGDLGESIDVDLAGTWTLDGGTVTFDQPGDTFIRDVPFTAEPDRLEGEGVFEGITVRAVLTK